MNLRQKAKMYKKKYFDILKDFHNMARRKHTISTGFYLTQIERNTLDDETLRGLIAAHLTEQLKDEIHIREKAAGDKDRKGCIVDGWVTLWK